MSSVLSTSSASTRPSASGSATRSGASGRTALSTISRAAAMSIRSSGMVGDCPGTAGLPANSDQIVGGVRAAES
jgi:hypothetical protein